MQFLWVIASAVLFATAEEDPYYKICVADYSYSACVEMSEDVMHIIKIKCVETQDSLDCLHKIKHNIADFGPFDPEDMYMAAKIDNEKFNIFTEIRTKEESNAEFQYDAVAVVQNDLIINSLHSLKGLASCHTGYERNAGYKIPIARLTEMKILEPLKDYRLSLRENELQTLSNFFGKACIVGKWSSHKLTHLTMKAKYHNLCSLCEHPDKCDYPDAYSGHDGALRCLLEEGQIAWTKDIAVKKFFGMTRPSYNNSEYYYYSYLCPNGTKIPLAGAACPWASRPWPGYVALHKETNNKELRAVLTILHNIGKSKNADWMESVLALTNSTLLFNNIIKTPKEYLQNGNYWDVMESGRPKFMCANV